jgi:murein L,D-transpeptidase YafK
LKFISIAPLLLAILFLEACGSPPPHAFKQRIDRIVIAKSAHTMILMSGASAIASYRVAIGRGSLGAKQQTGDHRTPEGNYVIDTKRNHSRFYLALHLSYPNEFDRVQAQRLGVDPGGAIEIHGLPPVVAWIGSLHRSIDWTDGCVAVTNQQMREIWPAVTVGTPVEIRP